MRKAFDHVGGEARFHGHTLLRLVERIGKMLKDGPEDAPPLPEAMVIHIEPDPGLTRWQTIEKEAIRMALARHCGNVQAASAWLGLGRNTVFTKMKQYGQARE